MCAIAFIDVSGIFLIGLNRYTVLDQGVWIWVLELCEVQNVAEIVDCILGLGTQTCFVMQSSTQAAAMVETATEQPAPVFRKDYKPTPYLVDTVSLSFDLNEDVTTVTAQFNMVPNYESDAPPAIEFNGRADMTLESVKVKGENWSPKQYTLTPKMLTLEGLPKGEFPIEIVTKIKPQDNTGFEGLYKSSGNFCTQARNP